MAPSDLKNFNVVARKFENLQQKKLSNYKEQMNLQLHLRVGDTFFVMFPAVNVINVK